MSSPSKKTQRKKKDHSSNTRERLVVIDGGAADGLPLPPDAVLATFNEEAGTDYRSGRYLAMIEARVRERPDADIDRHRQAIRRTLAAKWFKRDPSPNLVYASDAAFERALNLPEPDDADDMSVYNRG